MSAATLFIKAVGTTFANLRHDGVLRNVSDEHVEGVVLCPDPDNHHDPRAVAITLVVNGVCYRVGYVPSHMLDQAHAQNWTELQWTIASLGTYGNGKVRGGMSPWCHISAQLPVAPAQQQ
jgi:hypothetical protein